MKQLFALAVIAVCFMSCTDKPLKGTYAYDKSFLKDHTNRTLELSGPDGAARLLLTADYQARVMTSTATGDTGLSFGWLNYDLIAAAEKKKQFNPVGGEERFWLGPEGSQYAFYFRGGDSFDIAHWQVPPILDIAPFRGKTYGDSLAIFEQRATLTNYSGTVFDIGIERQIQLLDKKRLEERLQTTLPEGIHTVAYETINTLFNEGSNDWTKEKGLPSVWLLGMFTPSPQTKVIIPFHPSDSAKKYISTDYFGAIPADRLQIKDSSLVFTCDGRYRSKIGISPAIAKPIAAAFDASHNVLTVVMPQVEKDAGYVNSKWGIQQQPYKGDVINSYNDGPLAGGGQLGPFFEIESSSP
ncbi:MAG: hypothetical protein JST39_05500, partial [Bacteroidetes bacterium]|nr:hypothetical protein [Bacteroidota bacterium]